MEGFLFGSKSKNQDTKNLPSSPDSVNSEPPSNGSNNESFYQRARRLSINAYHKAKDSAKEILQKAELSMSNTASLPPEEDLVYRAHWSLDLIDHYANSSNADSLEADRSLHSCKLREHARAMITILSKESEKWKEIELSSKQSINMEAMPCITIFIQKNIFQEFVDRALLDRPRGCLPLTLAIASSLMTRVNYPLITEYSVQQALNQLVGAAYRYDDAVIARKGAAALKEPAFGGYKKRIDVNLTDLLHILWKRLKEFPIHLDNFQTVDRRFIFTLEDTPADADLRQMDILMTLVHMLNKAHTHKQAREGLLLAISLHDPTVTRLVAIESELVEYAVMQLCRTFEVAVKEIMEIGNRNVGQLSYTNSKTNSSDDVLDDDEDDEDKNNEKNDSTLNQGQNKSGRFSSFGLRLINRLGMPMSDVAKQNINHNKSNNNNSSSSSKKEDDTAAFFDALDFLAKLAQAAAPPSSTATGNQHATHDSRNNITGDSKNDMRAGWHRLSSPSGLGLHQESTQPIYGITSALDGALPAPLSPDFSNNNSKNAFQIEADEEDEEYTNNKANDLSPTNECNTTASPELAQPNVNLLAELQQTFKDMFLYNLLLPKLLSQREDEFKAAQQLTREALLVLLQHDTAVGCNEGALLSALAGCICGSATLLSAMMIRSGSVSRDVAVTTLQLFAALLTAAPIRQSTCLLLGNVVWIEGDGEEGDDDDGDYTSASKGVVDADNNVNSVDGSFESPSVSESGSPIRKIPAEIASLGSKKQGNATNISDIKTELDDSQKDVNLNIISSGINSAVSINNHVTSTSIDGRQRAISLDTRLNKYINEIRLRSGSPSSSAENDSNNTNNDSSLGVSASVAPNIHTNTKITKFGNFFSSPFGEQEVEVEGKGQTTQAVEQKKNNNLDTKKKDYESLKDNHSGNSSSSSSDKPKFPIMEMETNSSYSKAASMAILSVLAGNFAEFGEYVRKADIRETKAEMGNDNTIMDPYGSDIGSGSDDDEKETISPPTSPSNSNSHNSDLDMQSELKSLKSPLLNLTRHKLLNFLSLKFEEQLAVTGLVERIVSLLSAMVVVANPSSLPGRERELEHLRDIARLEAVLGFLKQTSGLWEGVGAYLERVPGSFQKMDALMAVLNGPRPEARKRKLLSREAEHNVRLLETGVMVRELLLELQGGVLAIHELRSTLGSYCMEEGGAMTSHLESEAEGAADHMEVHQVTVLNDNFEDAGGSDDDDDAQGLLDELEALENSLDNMIGGSEATSPGPGLELDADMLIESDAIDIDLDLDTEEDKVEVEL